MKTKFCHLLASPSQQYYHPFSKEKTKCNNATIFIDVYYHIHLSAGYKGGRIRLYTIYLKYIRYIMPYLE